jgi:hypothetical protein
MDKPSKKAIIEYKRALVKERYEHPPGSDGVTSTLELGDILLDEYRIIFYGVNYNLIG